MSCNDTFWETYVKLSHSRLWPRQCHLSTSEPLTCCTRPHATPRYPTRGLRQSGHSAPTGIQFVMYKFGKLFTLFPLADSSQQLYKLYHVRVVLTSQLESSRTKENWYLLEVLASRRTGGKRVEICRKLVESNDLRCHALMRSHALKRSHALHNSMTSLWNEGSVASNISTIFSSKASAKHSKTRTSRSQITAIDEWHHKCYSANRLCLWQEWAEKERSPPCRRSSL